MASVAVLVVTAQDPLAQQLAAPLAGDGFTVTRAASSAFLERLEPDSMPDLVILDWDVAPQQRAPALLQQTQTLGLPCLVILSRKDLETFDLTPDVGDLLVLPVYSRELLLRVRGLLGRAGGKADPHSLIRVGDLSIDPESYEVLLGDRRVLLTFKEYQLLLLLASSPGRVFTREALLRQVWEYDYFGGTRTVDVHIRRLRSKIEDADRSFIETVRNVGYRVRPLVGKGESADPSLPAGQNNGPGTYLRGN